MDQVGVGSNPIIHLFRLVVRGPLLPRTTGGIEKEELGRHGKPVPPGDAVGVEARKGAPLAQLAEHLTLNQAVEGSIPSRRNFSVWPICMAQRVARTSPILGGCWNW